MHYTSKVSPLVTRPIHTRPFDTRPVVARPFDHARPIDGTPEISQLYIKISCTNYISSLENRIFKSDCLKQIVDNIIN